MREKKHGLQLLFIVMALCHLLFPVHYVYGKKAVEMPVRPFALNPENRHLRLDGIFDTRADIHGIGIYLENVGDTGIENVTATASFAPGSGIVIKEDFWKFGNLAPGNPLFGYFQASFAASSPGKYPLILEVSGDSFKQTIKRDVYVIRSETDPHDPYQWTVKTPGGTLTTKVRELYRSDKLGSSAAVKTYKWVVEYIDRPEGQFSALPYSDPWWKVIGSIVPVGGPPTIIDSQIENLYGPGLGDTVKSVGRAAFTTSALVVTSNKTDPFRRGQEETKPGPDEATIKEEVEVSVKYLAEPVVGKPYRADVQWTYTRSTKVQEYRYKFKQKVRNTHSSGKSPKIKFKRRKSAAGQDFLITVRTRSPKLRNNEAYFVANLFKADDTRYKNVVQAMVLQDNGQQGDRKAGDGIYTAVASADRFPPGTLPQVLVFGFDINRAAESDPPEIAAAKLGGVLISAPPSIL